MKTFSLLWNSITRTFLLLEVHWLAPKQVNFTQGTSLRLPSHIPSPLPSKSVRTDECTIYPNVMTKFFRTHRFSNFVSSGTFAVNFIKLLPITAKRRATVSYLSINNKPRYVNNGYCGDVRFFACNVLSSFPASVTYWFKVHVGEPIVWFPRFMQFHLLTKW